MPTKIFANLFTIRFKPSAGAMRSGTIARSMQQVWTGDCGSSRQRQKPRWQTCCTSIQHLLNKIRRKFLASPNQGALCQGVLDHETWRASFFNLVSRNGRDQPRHSVVRQPPGANRLHLIPTQPMDLIVRAKRRALPVVMGKSSRARRATVLVHVRLAGSARSSARLQGSSWPSDSSACARCNLPSSDMNASCGHLLPG
jgi:hypothetical protein